MGELKGFGIGKNIEKVIFDLEVGKGGWTNLKALELHYSPQDHFLFLEEPISEKYDEKNKKTLYVERTGPDKNDFIVDASKSEDFLWKRIFLKEKHYNKGLKNSGIAILEYEKIKNLDEQILEAIKNEEYEKAGQLKRSKEN